MSQFKHYVGIDPSKVASGLQHASIDESGTLVYHKPFTFTTVAKNASETHKHYKRDKFVNDYALAKFMTDELIARVPDGSLVIIEGYAMAGQGRIADLAEFGGILRYRLLTEKQCSIRLVAPTALKMFATGSGNAKKGDMVEAYLTYSKTFIEPNWRIPDVTIGSLEDIADAFHLTSIGYHSENNTERWQKFIIDNAKKASAKLTDTPLINSF